MMKKSLTSNPKKSNYAKDFKRVLICKLCGKIYWPHEIPRRYCKCGSKLFDSVSSQDEYYGKPKS